MVFDFVAVVGEADIALAQLGEMRGEIEVVADFPVGAFFRLQAVFGHGLAAVQTAAAGGGGQFVKAGEAAHAGIAGEEAVVVGKIVADRQHGRPRMRALFLRHAPAVGFAELMPDPSGTIVTVTIFQHRVIVGR